MAVKYNKWTGYIVFGLDEVLEILANKGIEMSRDRTVITGSLYNPETQQVSIFVTSMLTTAQSNKFSKEFEELWGSTQKEESTTPP